MYTLRISKQKKHKKLNYEHYYFKEYDKALEFLYKYVDFYYKNYTITQIGINCFQLFYREMEINFIIVKENL